MGVGKGEGLLKSVLYPEGASRRMALAARHVSGRPPLAPRHPACDIII